MDHKALREEIALVSRRMSDSGLVTGTEGNVSARTPDGDVLITASGLDYALMDPEDVVLVDLDARVLEGSELLEEMAEIFYRARLAGGPVLLTPEQMAEVSAKIHDYGQYKPSSAGAE